MITVINANALHIPLPDQSVQCVITSPPYWGLRDYGTAKWEGGSAECDHIGRQAERQAKSQPGTGNAGNVLRDGANGVDRICAKCGATRIDAQIGLESTPAAYVANIVSVMRECWRVLKDDGTCWLNLGDSYNGSAKGYNGNGTWQDRSGTKQGTNNGLLGLMPTNVDGLKPKDLCGIPWRVAFALQDDGWYLRSDIIWHKPNPMPESVTDRPTKAHEYVFLLTKQARYYYDAEAIKEAYEGPMYLGGNGRGLNKDRNDGGKAIGANGTGRNRRSVWTVATSPYSGAHFATFPPALIEPMILAGTSARGECPHCGKGWMRVVENIGDRKTHGVNKVIDQAQGRHGSNSIYNTATVGVASTIGWRPDCACYDVPPLPDEPEDVNGNMAAYKAERQQVLDLYATLPTVPQLVLDPFAGTATVGRVCAKHGRQFIGTELNLKYIDLADERTSSIQQVML